MQSAPGIEGDEPEDWGITCTRGEHTEAWLAEGGNAYVVKQILVGFTSAGAKTHIVALHGPAEARETLSATLQAFADEHPQCAPELRRFATGERE